MPWPYSSQWHFETGAGTELGAETDSAGQLAVRHYSELARFGAAPFSGAYCIKVDPDGSATDAYFTDASTALLEDETGYWGFALYLSKDFTYPASGYTELLKVMDGTANIASVLVSTQGGALRFGISHDTSFTHATTYDIPLGKWIWVELVVNVSNAGPTAYTELYVREDGGEYENLLSLTGQTTVSVPVDGTRFGMVNTVDGPDSGFILLDSYYYHDPDDVNEAEAVASRITWSGVSWRKVINVDVARHVFVGPGTLDNLQMIAGDADVISQIRVYDTDRGSTGNDSLVAVLNHTAANEVVDLANVPIKMQNGCYIEVRDTTSYSLLAGGEAVPAQGTAPRAIATVSPRYWGSRSLISQYGLTVNPA